MNAQKQSQEPLSFKPVNEGLGFHPFSDGLPYAPTQPNANVSSGITAGLTTGVTTGMNNGLSAPQNTIRTPVLPAQTIQRQHSPTHRISEQPVLKHHYGFTYVLKRFLAYILDSTFNIGCIALSFGWVLYKMRMPLEVIQKPQNIAIIAGFLFITNWMMITAQEVVFKTTLFKRLFGLGFNSNATSLLFRAMYFVPSMAFFGLGMFWAIFDPQRKCWHDAAVDSQPIVLK